MTCPNCGHDVRAGQRFCDNCGHGLASACSACGAAVSPTGKYCPECGTPVARVAPVSADTPGRRDEDVRERRVASVLFADLVGFTATAAEHGDPERTRDFQERYFAICRDVVARYGGTIEKYIGDAVMAVWGVPSAHEDDAERAVRAALDLVAAVSRIGATARAAVATGEVAAAANAVAQGIVAGDVVNLAARLQGIARPGDVLVDATTSRRIAAAIATEDAGEHELKGVPAPTRAFRAARVIAGRGRSHRPDEVEPRFVGRDAEIAVLKDLFAATSAERRLRLVSITGQAGIGKSRLAWEFSKSVDALVEPVHWHQGRSPAYGEGITFWALGEMVRQRAGLSEDADAAATRAGIAALLEEWVDDSSERQGIERSIAVLLGIEESSPAEQGELFTAWRSLFEHIARRGPVVLVFEDLQWADSGLLEFIRHLAEWSRQERIFVITLARPELYDRVPTWGARQRNFTSLHLEPLRDDAMEALVSALVPRLPQGAMRAIVSRAEGVPLYAVEWVRMLVDNGTLTREGAAYRLTRSLADVPTPESLHGLIGARIDAVPPELRQRLQHAAVLGSSFTVAAFRAVTQVDEAPAQDVLTSLVERELLRIETDPGSPERGQYQFVQAVVREVAYSRLSRRDRKALHLAAARYFESLGDEELAGALARHYLEAAHAAAGEADEAALTAQARVALRAATDRAVSLHAYDQALALTKLSLSVVDDPAEAAALKLSGAERAVAAVRLTEGVELYREAVDAYRALGDVRGACGAALGLATELLSEARLLEGRTVAEKALADLAAGPDDELAIRLRAQVARSYFLATDNKTARRLIDSVIDDAERIGLMPVLVDAFVTKGPMLVNDGDRQAEGMALLLGSIELARLHGLPRTELRALGNAGRPVGRHYPAAAERMAREMFELSRRLGLRDDMVWASVNVAFVNLELGRVDESRRFLDIVAGSEEDVPNVQVHELAIRSMIAALEGRDDEVHTLQEAASDAAKRLESPAHAASVPFTRGWTSLVLGDAEAAVRETARALELEPADDSFPFTWLSRAFLRLRRLDDARIALERAGEYHVRGRRLAAHMTTSQAGIAAAEGRIDDAERLFEQALEDFTAIGDVLGLVLAQLEIAINLGVSRPLGAATAEKLRETTKDLGWAGVERQLDAAIERGPLARARHPQDTPANDARERAKAVESEV